MKVMKVGLGTGFCGCDTTEYYKLTNQEQTEILPEDWEPYAEMAVAHCENYGYDYQWYLEDNDLYGDGYDYYDNYECYCCEQGYIEIIEVEDDFQVDGEW